MMAMIHPLEPINYAEKLFKIKQLEYKRDEAERMTDRVAVYSSDKDWIDRLAKINSQISKLLEDE